MRWDASFKGFVFLWHCVVLTPSHVEKPILQTVEGHFFLQDIKPLFHVFLSQIDDLKDHRWAVGGFVSYVFTQLNKFWILFAIK